MKVPRSPMFYFFAIPFTSCTAIGMYSIYDSPIGQFLKTQGTNCLGYISEAAIKTYTSEMHDYNWPFQQAQPSIQSDDPKKKPPPMPY